MFIFLEVSVHNILYYVILTGLYQYNILLVMPSDCLINAETEEYRRCDVLLYILITYRILLLSLIVITYKECPHTLTSNLRLGFRYFVVLQRGHDCSSMTVFSLVSYERINHLTAQVSVTVYGRLQH